MKLIFCPALITIFTLVGCEPEQKNTSTPSTAPKTVSSALEINVAQPSPHFGEIMSRLDIGGKSLHFEDHEGRREFWIAIVEMMMSAVPEEQMPVEADAANMIDASGFLSSAASGRSLSKDGDGWLLRHYTSFPNGLPDMMSLLGEQQEFATASRLPATTDLSLEARINATSVSETILRWGKMVSKEEEVENGLKELTPLGVDFDTLLSEMSMEILIGIDLEATIIPQMPVMPKHVFVEISAKKELIDRLLPLIAESLGESTPIDNLQAWPLPFHSLPGLAKGRPHLIYDGAQSLTLVSSLEHFENVHGDGEKLSDQPLFQAATNHFGASGNLLFYASPEVSEAALKWISVSVQDNPQARPIVSKLQQIETKLPWAFYLGCEDKGLIAMAETPHAIDSNAATTLTLLSASSTLFIGARSWKNGSDRATCILQTRNIQQAVRSLQNMNALEIGAPLDWEQIFGPEKFIANKPTCPLGGTYTFVDTFPEVGDLAGHCSHEDHLPENHQDW